MIIFSLAEKQLVAFVLVDSGGVEVPGLGSTFTVAISKNGGAFIAGTGTKAEVSDGWYTYELTASETDTEGPLAVKITGTGAIQQNLLYEVSGSIWVVPAGDYILTPTEASNVLRCAIDDPNMLALLPAIDAYIEMATGRNWAADSIICQEAKSAARILLVQWHEDPGMMAGGTAVLSGGLQACLTQLEAMAFYHHIFEGLSSAGYIYLDAAREGDTVTSLVGKVGSSGDQSAKFEGVITVDGTIQQTSSDNLEDKWYEVKLVPPGEM